MESYADILFIDEVRALQDGDGMGEKFQSMYPQRTKKELNELERQFLTERESFYLATVSSNDWPYVQHRGGPKGFLKVLGPTQLGFADYRGNRQFITMGHTTRNNKVALFFMDYERRARLKMLGHLTMQHVQDAEPSLIEKLKTPGQGRTDRIATIDIIAIDWNCPQFIPPLIHRERAQQYVNTELKSIREENEKLKEQIRNLTQ